MKLETGQFGEIEYTADAVVRFPEGLLGFEHLTSFLLVDQDEIEPLRWLQPIEDPTLAFNVIDPGVVWPDYRPRLSGEDREVLGLQAGEQPLVLALVTVPDDPRLMTANLLGPLVIQPDKKVGRQLVLHDSGYSTRERLIPDTAPHAVPV